MKQGMDTSRRSLIVGLIAVPALIAAPAITAMKSAEGAKTAEWETALADYHRADSIHDAVWMTYSPQRTQPVH